MKMRRCFTDPHYWKNPALRRSREQSHENDVWYYTDQNGTLHLTIAPIRARARKVVPVEQIPAPRKRWVDTKKEDKTVAATQIDVLLESQENLAENDRDRSPRRASESKEKPKAKKVLDPDKVFIAQNPNWTFENHGGQGDCAFRCAAFSIAKQQNKTLSSDALIREASRLRVLATGHLTSHKAKFEPFWAPDPDEEKLFRANLEVPTEYADYVLAASQRGYYADDLLLTALADRLNTAIIVFAWSTTRQIWERSVVSSHFERGVATPGKKGFKPIHHHDVERPPLSLTLPMS